MEQSRILPEQEQGTDNKCLELKQPTTSYPLCANVLHNPINRSNYVF